MTSDLREALAKAAGEAPPLDAAAVVARGRQLRRRTRAATTAVGVWFVVVALVAVGQVGRGPEPAGPTLAARAGTVALPEPGGIEATLVDGRRSSSSVMRTVR
jgi:hypothetical protein